MSDANLKDSGELPAKIFQEMGSQIPKRGTVVDKTYYSMLILSFLISALTSPILVSDVLAAEGVTHHILISKSSRQLSVISAEGVTLRTYPIASGRGGPGDKYRLGDQKTPTGRYKVAGFKSNSDFFYFIRLNYPNENDARRGFRDRLINKRQYDAILEALDSNMTPPQDTKLGGAIGIHGIGDESQSKINMHNTLDWTQGCIALRNHEVEDLLAFLSVGIHVVIKD